MDKRPYFFHHTLGFRRNPFGALTDEEWVAVAVLPPTVLALLSPGYGPVQLLGPMGSGKSTMLLKLADQFSRVGSRTAYEYLAAGEHRIKTETADLDVFLLDEAQRLSLRARRQLLKLVGSKNSPRFRLIFSSHKDLTPYFHWRKLPLVTLRLENTITRSQYSQMLARRLDYFALPDRVHTTLAPDAIHWLYDNFAPNLRAAEYFLYEVWQQETAVRAITAVELSQYMANI